MSTRAGAAVPSANRIVLLRDTDGDGVADVINTFIDGPGGTASVAGAYLGKLLLVEGVYRTVKNIGRDPAGGMEEMEMFAFAPHVDAFDGFGKLYSELSLGQLAGDLH